MNTKYLKRWIIYLLQIEKLLLFAYAKINISDCNEIPTSVCEVEEELEEKLENENNYYYCFNKEFIYILDSSYSSCYFDKYEVEHPINLLKINMESIQRLSLESMDFHEEIDLANLVYVQMYNDNEKNEEKLEQRNGIFMDKNSNFYYIYGNNEMENKKIDITEISCSSNVGGLSKIEINSKNTVVLCLTENKYKALPTDGENSSDNFMIGKNNDNFALESSFTFEKSEIYSVIRFGVNHLVDLVYTSNEPIF
ncbi:hypothetical protein BCR32DRAFT_270004, partial [Anaeromyces robustus]